MINLDKYIKKLIDESTPINPLWNIEIKKKNINPSWNYIDGLMLGSLLKLYKLNNDLTYLDFVINYVDYFVNEFGIIKTFNYKNYSLDDMSCSNILFDLYEITKNEKYKLAINYTYNQIINNPRTFEGSFWHKPRHKNQVWLDGLYMALVFYMNYEVKINNYKKLDDILNQFMIVKNNMLDEVTGLYYHGYCPTKEAFWCDKETGLSKSFWLRSIGWFLMSLIEILDILDKNIVDYNFYLETFKDLVDSILKYQDKSGMFYQVVDKGNLGKNYLETSGTAMVSYVILKAVRLNILDISYQKYGILAFEGIVDKYLKLENETINLGGICLLAGLGNMSFRDGSFIHYTEKEEVVENDAKGLAPFLMAYIEYNQIKK